MAVKPIVCDVAPILPPIGIEADILAAEIKAGKTGDEALAVASGKSPPEPETPSE